MPRPNNRSRRYVPIWSSLVVMLCSPFPDGRQDRRRFLKFRSEFSDSPVLFDSPVGEVEGAQCVIGARTTVALHELGGRAVPPLPHRSERCQQPY